MDKNIIKGAENLFDYNLILLHGSKASEVPTILQYGLGMCYFDLDQTATLITHEKVIFDYYWDKHLRTGDEPVNIVIGIPEAIIGPAHRSETARGREQLSYIEHILTFIGTSSDINTDANAEELLKEKKFKYEMFKYRGFYKYFPPYFIKGIIKDNEFIKNPNYIMYRPDMERLISKTIERMNESYMMKTGKEYVIDVPCLEGNEFYHDQVFMGEPIKTTKIIDTLTADTDKQGTKVTK